MGEGRVPTGQETEFVWGDKGKMAKGRPVERANVEVDFFRGMDTRNTVYQDQVQNGFYEAPTEQIDRNGNRVTVSAPTRREAPTKNYTPASAIPCPACGGQLQNVSRDRVRCQRCGGEFQDNEA